MDIFSKIGAKAEETIQTIKDSDTTKKALNYAEIPGLSVQVGKQESIVKKAYTDIGEKFYKEHKNDCDSEYAEQFKKITVALKKIDELKKEIEEKKKYDPSKENCGKERNSDSCYKSTDAAGQSSVLYPATEVQTVVNDQTNWEA